MRYEAEWGSVVDFLEEYYQIDNVDVFQLKFDTLLEHKAYFNKLLDNVSEFTLTSNDNTTLAESPGERILTLLKQQKFLNGWTESNMNRVDASRDNRITKAALYAPSSQLYRADTYDTKNTRKKITRRNTTHIIPLIFRENHRREHSAEWIFYITSTTLMPKICW